METIKVISKEDFFFKIKEVIVSSDVQIVLEHDNTMLARLIVNCNDSVISLKGRSKDASYVTGNLKRQTGESIPIDEIINWFETNVFCCMQ